MTDTLSVEKRSALMRRVKRANTAPEMALRRELHQRGFRYIVGDKRLPGTPDLVFPKHRAIIFVHGCFWHGHSCRQGRTPSSNVEYWAAKIEANRARDKRKSEEVQSLGWRVFIVWECDLKSGKLTETAELLGNSLRLAH